MLTGGSCVSEGFLLMSWMILKKLNWFSASPPVFSFLCARWCDVLGCDKAGLSSEAERWIILIADFYIKIQNLEVCSTCYFTQFCTLFFFLNLAICEIYIKSLSFRGTNYIHLNFRLTLLGNLSHLSFTSANTWFLMCLTDPCKTVV